MIQNSLFVLVLVALAACLGMAWIATTKVPFFPPAFLTSHLECDAGAPNLPRQAQIDPFEDEWYSGLWREADEPSLYLKSQDPHAIPSLRFSWAPALRPAVFVRIDHMPSGGDRLTAKMLPSVGGDDQDFGAKRFERYLRPGELQTLTALLGRAKPFDLIPTPCDAGADGAQWILEDAAPGRYRMVNRWSPKSGPIYQVGRQMLSLTGWNISPTD